MYSMERRDMIEGAKHSNGSWMMIESEKVIFQVQRLPMSMCWARGKTPSKPDADTEHKDLKRDADNGYNNKIAL
jgi:hypothetical protein